jgi:tetratricopeptide (TPR) repeat protein
MQLLIQRGQRKIIVPIFDLWAKFELNPEEETLIAKYHVRQHILVEGKPLQRWVAAIFGIIIAGLFAASMQHLFDNQIISFFVWGVGSFLLYHQFREEIRVRDILDGRHFACRSVVKLMDKEQEVAEMAHAFRHLLEAMKNWGGREIIELKPYEAPALRLLEPPQIETTGGEIRGGLPPNWIRGIGIITGLAGIGGFLYFVKPFGIYNVTQKPISIQSNLSKSNIPQKTPAYQQPDMWRENMQEADVMQVLTLSEEKFQLVKKRAEKSLPPKQGNRKVARAANDRGLVYLQGGRITDAINSFLDAYRTNPADVEIVNNLAYAYLLNNDPVSAENYLLTALAMRWDRAAAWGNLGQAYVKKGQMADAVVSFSNAYRFSRDLKQTHSRFLTMMEKEKDPNLKLALRQATQVGKKWYMKK